MDYYNAEGIKILINTYSEYREGMKDGKKNDLQKYKTR